MNKQPPLSKHFFTNTPDKLDIYVGSYEPKAKLTAYSEEFSENARDWFDLYYDALNAYTPERQPRQPNALQDILVTPYSGPFNSMPLLAISGRYIYGKSTPKVRPVIARPVAIAIETHAGYEDHLSYRSAFNEDEAPIALPESISVDIAKLMIGYFRRPVMTRYDSSRGM